MAEYIDREKILPNGVFYVCESHPEKSLDELINRICDAPTEDVQKVKYARWKGAGMGVYYCSLCQEEYSGGNHFNYCPYCGAKMDGDVE